MVVYVGLDLTPEGAAGSATAEAYAVVTYAELAEEREGVLEAEGDALKDGADEVSCGGAGGDADEGGAGVGVKVGCALAEEIGGPEEAVGCGWDGGGEGGEFVVSGGGEEGVLEVAEAEACAVGDAHDVPDAGGGVAEGVEAALGVERRCGCGGEDYAGGADGGGDRAGSEDAHADGTGALVACASGYGGVDAQAGGGSACGRDVGADFGAFEEGWEPGEGNPGGFGDLGRPAAVDDIEEEGSRGLLHIHGVGTGHAEADVVLGAEDVGDLGEDLGLVVADPEELGEGEVGERGVGGELDESLVADLFGEPVALGLGALVAPDEGGAEDCTGGVEHDAAVHLAGEADSFYGSGMAGGGWRRI